MRRKISLYIADQLVDLDDSSFILFNYTMEDLSNPTIVKNSFSQQITIKGTPNNNKLFGSLFRLDRTTTSKEFNASKRTPFVIFNAQDEIIESGYVKLNDVVRTSADVEYKISLFGGIGTFFYTLMYNEDGSKKTLLDMRYLDLRGQYTNEPGDLSERSGWQMVSEAWEYLSNPQGYDLSTHDNYWCHIVNFAPCYNGIPENFSANKAVYNKMFENIPTYHYFNDEDGKPIYYSYKKGASSLLLQMTNPHTEWEMRDLRWYLQRPVIRVKAIVDAICDSENNGGYEVILSDRLKSNAIYTDGWITLPLIALDDRHMGRAILNHLAQTLSPAEYIISLAKILGLVFIVTPGMKKVEVMFRSELYKIGAMIDLSERVNTESITISPILAQSRFYQFGSEVIGEWATQYKIDFQKDYGIYKVNTGNEFNADTTIVTEGILYKDAVEVNERSLLFLSNNITRDEMGGVIENFYLPHYESVHLQMWREIENGEEEMREYQVIDPYEWDRYPFNPTSPLSDFLPKVQLHEADNKIIDGNNILLLFNGVKNAPEWNERIGLEYYLTDDTPDMLLLNDGVPCWNYSSTNRSYLYSLPSFRRCITDENGVIQESLEWGESYARGATDAAYGADAQTLYNKYWRDYQRDRYDVDTFIMKCKVDLRDVNVNQRLLGNFFYYQGAIFVLNAIMNHSFTTYDDTECEFVKVQDIENYKK